MFSGIQRVSTGSSLNHNIHTMKEEKKEEDNASCTLAAPQKAWNGTMKYPDGCSAPAGAEEEMGPTGCYMVYESSSSGRLMLYYSKGPVPDNAVGFWCPGNDDAKQKIQGFKFKQNAGRSELIKGIAGGDANRRKYYSGWCQFIKMAVAKQGYVIQFTPTSQPSDDTRPTPIGVPVDIYGYLADIQQPVLLSDLTSQLVDVSRFDGIACMPKNHEFLKGVKSITVQHFLELGNIAGASTTM